MSASLLLLSVVAFQSIDYRDWKPFVRIDEFVPSEFKFDGESYSRSAETAYSVPEHRKRLLVTALEIPADKTIEEGWRPWFYISAVVETSRRPPSGLPLGDDAFFHGSGREAFLSCLVGRTIVKAQMEMPRGGAPDLALVEGAVRYVLANLAGRGHQGRGSAKVGGVLVPTSFSSPLGRFVPLDAWSRASGRKVDYDKRRGLASFTTNNGRKVTFALGAKGYQLGAKWVPLASPVARKDGQWLVPVRALEALD